MNSPLGSGALLNRISRNVDIKIEGRHLPVDLAVLDMVDFDVILGVDWLVKHRVVIDCHDLVIQFNMPNGDCFAHEIDV